MCWHFTRNDIIFQLIGFGMSVLQNVDPNPENFVCTGIMHTKNAQIGCLMRLEPNKQAQVRTAGVCLISIM